MPASRLRPWSARAWALCSGLAAGLAHPPFGLLIGLLGYAGILAVVDAAGPRPLRSAFFRGWLAGVGYFAISVWWVVEPFMVDAENQGWMAPIALLLMAAGLALFWGLAALCYRALGVGGFGRVLAFAACLSAFEWLRGHVFTGFPWNLPGESWSAGSMPSQAAAVVGAYGLTWITVALGAAAVVLLDPVSRRRRAIAGAVAVMALAGLYSFGAGRLSQAAPTAPNATLIRVVQADIDQKDKWRPENLEVILDTYLSLSGKPAALTPDVIVWPEGALPAVIDDLLAPGSAFGSRLVETLGPEQTLLMGANRAGPGPDGETQYFNSLIALRREAEGLRVTGIYDKHRLVPFGEFLPFGEAATRLGLRSLVHMPSDFTAGPPPRPLAPWGVPPVQPLICYEALFPGFTRAASKREGVRPAWILNVSNDAWFGVTSGPLQHLNLASYRAIEEGLPIVRATPTGVSAVIDAYGRIQPGARLGLGVLGVIDARLPPALQPTLYARFGDLAFLLMMLLSGAVISARYVRRP
jgi:apolipoprotein N-acyltransferase